MTVPAPRWLTVTVLSTTLLTTGCFAPESMSPVTPNETAPAATATSTAIAPDPTLDLTVIPGERIGAIDATTSRADLVALYGEEHLTDEEVHVGEGFFEPGTTLDLGEGRSLSIVWRDDSRTQPVEVRNIGSAWTFPAGISLGTSFTELQDILGMFELTGFGWDYGGTVFLENTPLADYDDLGWIRVAPADGAIANNSDAYAAVLGDRILSSEDPNLATLDLRVDELGIYLNPVE